MLVDLSTTGLFRAGLRGSDGGLGGELPLILLAGLGLSNASKDGSRLLVRSDWELEGGLRSCESIDGRGALI